ncbi:MAG: EAL domain-containing protein, partial [Oryzihumus sp.]
MFLDACAESFETLPDDDWLRERLVLQLDSLRVLTHPASSLRAAEQARRHGWTIALRAVGATPATLATLPLLDPEVVRLDESVLHSRDL